MLQHRISFADAIAAGYPLRIGAPLVHKSVGWVEGLIPNHSGLSNPAPRPNHPTPPLTPFFHPQPTPLPNLPNLQHTTPSSPTGQSWNNPTPSPTSQDHASPGCNGCNPHAASSPPRPGSCAPNNTAATPTAHPFSGVRPGSDHRPFLPKDGSNSP